MLVPPRILRNTLQAYTLARQIKTPWFSLCGVSGPHRRGFFSFASRSGSTDKEIPPWRRASVCHSARSLSEGRVGYTQSRSR
jgi:hypothetical protein